MGVSKTILKEGTGFSPVAGQSVVIEYTGWLKDPSKPEGKGNKFDSSVGRGDFETPIGVGRVIRGWDEGVVTMKTGEIALLDISSDYAYGERGFTGHIPPNSDLLFQVELKGVRQTS
ncbi:FK506 binding protein proline rotamase rapamycin-binding protein [Zalerion maritima]|uniref:peptidylprolyl isomerase n=1 Tax=Zalerion maritima TaxID=339359 RepID=A0AAD5WVB4_9PEZI|nr:FK506 binding protein proline rotamase rapamycin-binding protein [Zalerion maritima]